MRLAIADPPYPPRRRARNRDPNDVVKRASRWYADQHAASADWDDPARHRQLLIDLQDQYDGWAIATTSDGIAVYGDLPPGARLLAWVRMNGQPGGARLRGCWEAVIARPARVRGRGEIPDVLIAGKPRVAFIGAKPARWTHWVLDALGYDPDQDTVDDLFPGSGLVTTAIASYTTTLPGVC